MKVKDIEAFAMMLEGSAEDVVVRSLQEKGLRVRVVHRDGTPLDVEGPSFDPRRVNVSIDEGVVFATSVG